MHIHQTSLSPQLGPQHELGSTEPSPGGSHSPAPRTAASVSLWEPGRRRERWLLSARLATLAGVWHLQGCQERIQSARTPNTSGQGPQQALGDKGPLLSSAGPGTGTAPPSSLRQLAILGPGQ